LWDWEEALVDECRSLLANVTLQVTNSDEWRWRLDNSGKYSICSVYDLLTSGGSTNVDEASSLVWHKQVPLKISILAWRLLRNRLPTSPAKDLYSCLEATSLMICIFVFLAVGKWRQLNISLFPALSSETYGSRFVLGLGLVG